MADLSYQSDKDLDDDGYETDAQDAGASQGGPAGTTTSPAPTIQTAAQSVNDPTLQNEVSYLSGVSNGKSTTSSFWGNQSITFSYSDGTQRTVPDYAHKWQQNATGTTATAGTAGGTVLYYFDPASNWTSAEQRSYENGFSLWSAVANIQFVQTTDPSQADVVIYRGNSDNTSPTTDGRAYENTAYKATPDGAANGDIARDVPTYSNGTHTRISIDTATKDPQTGQPGSFSQLASFSQRGGYGIDTVVHEEGHLLGLGHGGNYDGAVNPSTQQNNKYDSQLSTIMSYISPSATNPSSSTAAYQSQYPVQGTDWGTTSDGYLRAPYTWMPLDILAAQQLYGAPTSTPLSGGQIFGFNTNIAASTGLRDFFDFTVDTEPVITLYDTGTNNTLDLSGYDTGAAIYLRDGQYSSFAGLTNNMAIAFGTKIDNVVGTTGHDVIRGNADDDIITGNASGDVFTGGGGADIYKDTAADLNTDTVTDFISADVVDVADASGMVYNLAFDGTTLSFSTTPGGPVDRMTLQGGAVTGAPTQQADASGRGVDISFKAATPAPTAPAAVASSPIISNTHATETRAEAAVTPFDSVSLSDPNGGADDGVVIALAGDGGTLSGGGLTRNADGSYSLAATDADTLTAELDALTFTPAAPSAGTSASTTLTITLSSTAGTSRTDAGTVVTDSSATAPDTPTVAGTTLKPDRPEPVTPGSVPFTGGSAGDTVTVSPQVTFDGHGTFTITGAAQSAADVSSVDITALVDGVTTDLGTAQVKPDATFTFVDPVGRHLQGLITATETDSAGGTGAGTANYSLEGGLPGGGGEQDTYDADGGAVVLSTRFAASGQRSLNVRAAGRRVDLQPYDIVANHRQARTSFVFSAGDGLDVIGGFKVGGPNHDTIALPSSDFRNFADVLRDTGDVNGSAFITDPKTGDAIRLAGVTTAELKANPKDFTFVG